MLAEKALECQLLSTYVRRITRQPGSIQNRFRCGTVGSLSLTVGLLSKHKTSELRNRLVTGDNTMSRISTKFGIFAVGLFSLLLVVNAFAQETTGGLQGTVKDPSGAVVAHASVEVTGSALAGNKTLTTDSSGY